MEKKQIIFFIILGVILVIVLVMAYSTYGAPSEFGNATTTTCYIGGDDGIMNCTSNLTYFALNTVDGVGGYFYNKSGSTWVKIVDKGVWALNISGNSTRKDKDYNCYGDDACSDSYIVFNGTALIIKVN